jgi:hypothetical protein
MALKSNKEIETKKAGVLTDSPIGDDVIKQIYSDDRRSFIYNSDPKIIKDDKKIS